jgi:hypothetical protein
VFPSGTWFTQNLDDLHVRTPATPDVERLVDMPDRSEPAQIIMDFDQIRQLPRLLSMIEEAVMMERLHKSMNNGELDPQNPNGLEWRKYNRLTYRIDS